MRSSLVLFALLAAGCTDLQLQKNTARQAWALNDVYEQEVMNNLALFICDQGAMPWFSYANQSGSSVTDQGNIGSSLGWSRGSSGTAPLLLDAIGASFGLQRAANESFVLTPVNDPRKLELMRCAYQKALVSAGFPSPSGTCPDCQNRFNVFYTGDENGDINAKSKGEVTSECLTGQAWFAFGPKKCVPKHCCGPVGCYCGTYVWLMPGGRDLLTKLTLCILDYAINPLPTPLTKTVVYYLDGQGLPTTQAKAVSMVTGTVNITERNESLLNLDQATEIALYDKLQQRLYELNRQIEVFPKEGIVDPKANREDLRRRNDLMAQRDTIDQQVRYLKIQLQVGPLKQPYTRAPAPGSTNAILGYNFISTLNGAQTLNIPQ